MCTHLLRPTPLCANACISRRREMTQGTLSAGDGARALHAFRAAGLRGVDAFDTACRTSGVPDRVRLPGRALDALVAANIDYYALDSSDAAIARVIGVPFRKELRPDKALRCEPLRVLYLRANSRRPPWARPCPVTPLVRCALLACIRYRIALTSDAILPLQRRGLARDPVGIIILPGPTKALRRFLRAVVAASVLAALSHPVVKEWLTRTLGGGSTYAVSAALQACIVAIVVAFALLGMALAHEWARAFDRIDSKTGGTSDADGSHSRINTFLSASLCVFVLAVLLY